jgi:histidinol-phosphate aminotransferase
MRVFLEPNDCILSCPPTFGMYSFDAELNAARCIEVPRHADFSLDMESIRKAVETYRPKIFFITSPNNPDGSVLDAKTIDVLLELPTLVVLDEIPICRRNLGASLSQVAKSITGKSGGSRTFSKWAGRLVCVLAMAHFSRLLPIL